ncbi:MAG: hypothetical protein WBL67_17935 [Nitrososphaeraceae archaeon]
MTSIINLPNEESKEKFNQTECIYYELDDNKDGLALRSVKLWEDRDR